jgi:hypothetical protein
MEACSAQVDELYAPRADTAQSDRASNDSAWSAEKEYEKNPLYADVDAAEQ